jgi:hypothetical protein
MGNTELRLHRVEVLAGLWVDVKTIRYGEQAARNDEVGVFRVLQECGASFPSGTRHSGRRVQDSLGSPLVEYMVWHTRACMYCGVCPVGSVPV